MKTRILAGVPAAILLILLLYRGSFTLMLSIAAVISVLGYIEFENLFFRNRQLSRKLLIAVLIVFSIVAMRFGTGAAWFSFWLGVITLCARRVFLSAREPDFPRMVRELGTELLGYIYILSLFGFLVPIAESNAYGRQYLILLFLIVFIGDTAAYFVGSKIGKHRLAEFISPKKSVEGAVAAVLGAILSAAGWLYWLYPGVVTTELAVKILVFAPIGSLLAQFGDLFESLMKRSEAQKDSGSFLPGHGGLLDRLDGLAFAAPAFYFYIHQFLGPAL